jgi:hypothetical protein
MSSVCPKLTNLNQLAAFYELQLPLTRIWQLLYIHNVIHTLDYAKLTTMQTHVFKYPVSET